MQQQRRLLFALFLIAALLALAWPLLTPKLLRSEFSPGHSYRVDIYVASPVQRFIHSDLELPGFARLTKTSTRKKMDESGIMDLAQESDVRWYIDASNEIAVGTNTRFKGIAPEPNP
ncbi:hypothetical protein [Paracidovorax konjaci]|uniref:Uncharacterized protein n=1 Tax=Paracidovorax konjaci TaxID=32040 RepID=A0A1I1VBT0_9BURK|nr:hypothetical protein [Paracidovorax konjaci]SFD78563.1 hypothetical protein SAMN04489710_10682 [Paracidovorax konjaci]